MKLEMEELKNEVSNVDQQVSKLVPNTEGGGGGSSHRERTGCSSETWGVNLLEKGRDARRKLREGEATLEKGRDARRKLLGEGRNLYRERTECSSKTLGEGEKLP